VANRVIIGWIICLVGTALYLYGYFASGHASFIDWQANTPQWIVEFLPNIEAETGMVLMLASMGLIYWPLGEK
jgi:hypothetical protein